MADDNEKLAAANGGNAMPAVRSKAFRNALLARLPQLNAPVWRAGNAADVHDSISGLSDLGADSFLEVVARFAEKSHEQ